MSCCTLGARPDIETITKAMLDGLSVRTAAEQFGCTKFAIETHRRCLEAQGHKLNPKTPPPRRDGKPQSQRRPVSGQPDTRHRTEPDGDQTAETNFRCVRSLEELARLGPCEMPALEYGLAELGKPDDLATAIRLSEARTRTGSIDHAVYWVRTGRAST